jgi:hypothetical protein
MGDKVSFVAVVIMLWTLGIIMLVAAVVEFAIWVRYGWHTSAGWTRSVRASPIVAAVWFILGAAILLLLYLVATEQVT